MSKVTHVSQENQSADSELERGVVLSSLPVTSAGPLSLHVLHVSYTFWMQLRSARSVLSAEGTVILKTNGH